MPSAEWSERTRLLLTIAAGLAINGAVWGYTYLARNECEERRTALKKLEDEVRRLEVQTALEKQLNAELAQLKRENDRRARRLPELSNRDKLDKVMSELANRLKMVQKTRRIEPDRKPDVAGLATANFTCDVWRTQWEADYNALGECINWLEEHYDYVLAVENLNIAAKDSGMSVTGAKHNVSFDVVTYRYTRPTAP